MFEIAESQHGIITRAQLFSIGYSESGIGRLLRSHLEVVHPGVYRVIGSVRNRHQHLFAACAWLGDDARISHLTAAELLHLHGKPDDTHMTIRPTNRRGRGSSLVLHRRNIVGDRRLVDGIPCLSAARTIVDCGTLVDEETLETMCASAIRYGIATATTIAARCGQGHAGSAAVARVLKYGEVARLASRLEVRLARLLRKSKLPPSIAQYQVGRYKLDRAWPHLRFAVEADGFQFHGNRLQWKRDRERLAAIEAAGWRVVHVTWDDVTTRPAETLARLGKLAA
jgi:very-short-patch-repair endonuclease